MNDIAQWISENAGSILLLLAGYAVVLGLYFLSMRHFINCATEFLERLGDDRKTTGASL